MKQSNNEIIKALRYFSLFDYPPTAEEIYTFLKRRTSFAHFKSILGKMVRQGDIIIHKPNYKLQMTNDKSISNFKLKISNSPRYTIPEYGKKTQISNLKTQNYSSKLKTSLKKLQSWRFKLYIKLLSLFPQIKLVGLSGSMAMMNAGGEDDIDLFVITGKNRLFTARFITLLLAQILGLRRKRGMKAQYRVSNFNRNTPSPQLRRGRLLEKVWKQVSSLYNNGTIKQWNNPSCDKVCLNLFFDETDLSVPKFKRSEYVAHEVLQMKPIINKSLTYEKFLSANKWVEKIFPNAVWISSKLKAQRSKMSSKLKFLSFKLVFYICALIFDLFENINSRLQLFLINRHRTTEIVTPTQLWFHPDDFGEKINLKKFK